MGPTTFFSNAGCTSTSLTSTTPPLPAAAPLTQPTMAQQTPSYPPEVISEREGPELGETGKPYVIGKHLNSDYPVRKALPIPKHLQDLPPPITVRPR